MKYLVTAILACCLSTAVQAQSLPPVYRQLEEHYNQNAFEACLDMEKQVQRFAHNRIDTLAANSLFYLGDAFYQMGNTNKAVTCFEGEKKTLFALGLSNTEDYSNSLSNLAYLYLEAGDYSRAGHAADELLDINRKIYTPDDQRFAESMLSITDIYLRLDRFPDAEKILLHAVKAQKKKTLVRGLLLNKLGDLYTYTGQYSRAEKYLMESLEINAAEAGENSAEYANTAINLGILYMSQGKYPEAEEIFDIALSQIDPSESAYAPLLNNQALVFQSLGQLDRAENTLHLIRQADSIAFGPAHPNYAITLSNLGLVYADQKKFEDAEKALRKALAIQKINDEGKSLSYARKLNNLAKVLQLRGLAEDAVPLLEEARTIFKKIMGKSSPEYATASYNLGLALWKSGKGETGYKYLKSSADIRAKVLGKNHPRYAESQLKIAEYLWHKKMTRDARQSFNEVFQNYYFQIDETFPVLTEEEKSSFYYTHIREAFDVFNSFAVAHREEQPDLLGDVYNYLINTKAAIMFATEKVKASIRASGDTTLIQQYELWEASREKIAKLYSLNQEHPQLDSLLRTAHQLEKDLARKSSTFEGQFIRKKYDWRAIRQTLKAGEAAVEVLRFRNFNPEAGGNFAEEVRYGFLVVTAGTSEQPDLVLLKNGNDMESKFLKYYRNNIRYKMPDVYSWFHYFDPLAQHLKQKKITRVYLSPDGVYNQINLNTIENPDTKKFIVDEWNIHLVTNTRELTDVPSALDGSGPSILIGYPTFNLDTLLDNKARTEESRGAGISRTWRGGLLRYMRGEEGISTLPGTQTEVLGISELFGDGASAVFTGPKASEQAAREADNPRILHIATHGYFLEDEATGDKRSVYISSPLLNAGLILAGAENFLKTGVPLNDNGDDGILTAFEAMNMNLDQTELVVLSACETALGDVQNGEGVYGLQRAFKLAGARNIIMSLWNVDDDATQELMTTFYEEMLGSGDRHKAFRTAQQKLREKYDSPFYWGAFILVGR